MNRWLLFGVLTLWFLAAGTTATAQMFTDVSAASGTDVGGAKEGGASFGDVDGDGDLDLLVNASPRSYLLLNNGDGTFTDVTAASAPPLMTSRRRSALLVDLDNDGHPEIVRSTSGILEVLGNSGPPDFEFADVDYLIDEAADPDVNVEGVAALDHDGDGWLDLFAENTGPQIYDNPGDGSLAFVRLPPAMTGFPDGRAMPGFEADYVAVTDFDVDGDVDVAHRNEVFETLFVNGGDGSYSALSSPAFVVNTKAAALFCDFDANGLFDFIFTGGPGGAAGAERNEIHFQTSPGTFEMNDVITTGSRVIRDAACGDVDNDGDVDLYLAVTGGPDVLQLNQLTETGAIDFEASPTAFADLRSETAVFADYDDDGDMDLYVNRTGDVYTDMTTMMTVRDPADNVLYRNDTDNADYLMVDVRTTAPGVCPLPTLRPDVGAVLSLEGPDGWQSGVREINGGQGHGSMGTQRVHFGLPMGATSTYTLTVRFAASVYPTVELEVVPADLGPLQLLVIDATDIDGDGILTEHEVAAAGATPDPDGDGRPAWNDDDSDGDGMSDAAEAGDDDLCTTPVDADSSGVADFLEGPVDPDAGPGVDAGIDAGPGIDTGPEADSGLDGGTPGFAAHGSGCVQCTAGGDASAPPMLAFCLLILGVTGIRRRRRR